MEEKKKKYNERFAEAIIRGLKTRDLPEDTLRLIQGWLLDKDNPDAKDLLLKELFDETFSFERIPSKVAYRMLSGIAEQVGIRQPATFRRPLRQRLAFRVAAVVVPVLMIAGASWLMTGRNGGVAEKPVPVYASVTTGDTITEKIILPCGSEVILNSGSKIEYQPENFKNQRVVRLTGEAFFSVRATGSPFSVETADMTVRVLGTEFFVRSVADEQTTEVTLVEGSVEVSTGRQVAVLSPNEQFIYDRLSGNSEVTAFDTAEADHWWNTVTLDNIPFGEALRTIGGHFGVTFVIDDAIPLDRPVRGVFRNESLPEIMEILHTLTGYFDYEIKGGTVYVYGR